MKKDTRKYLSFLCVGWSSPPPPQVNMDKQGRRLMVWDLAVSLALLVGRGYRLCHIPCAVLGSVL